MELVTRTAYFETSNGSGILKQNPFTQKDSLDEQSSMDEFPQPSGSRRALR
jgi:hypothetical protein